MPVEIPAPRAVPAAPRPRLLARILAAMAGDRARRAAEIVARTRA